MRLAGKVAIISGAASGMGAATARMFAREGAKVVIADVLEHEGRQLADARDALRGGHAVAVPLAEQQPVAFVVDRVGVERCLIRRLFLLAPAARRALWAPR